MYKRLLTKHFSKEATFKTFRSPGLPVVIPSFQFLATLAARSTLSAPPSPTHRFIMELNFVPHQIILSMHLYLFPC